MRNIYSIQNRYLPREDIPDRTSVPEEGEEEKAPESSSGPEEDIAPKAVPQFAAEEGPVLKVSDIVSEDAGTIDTDELIAQTVALKDSLADQAE